MASISDDADAGTRGQHVFVSYSRADAEVVREIGRRLAGAGIDVWIDEQSIEPGTLFGEAIAKAVLQCRKMLVVWSARAAGRDSRWLLHERSILLHHDPGNTEKRIVPIVLDGTELPVDLQHLQAIDYRAADAVAQVLAACAGDHRKPPHDWGGTGLNTPVTSFWGRRHDSETMRNWILRDQCRVITICGLGGMGKTTLVRSLLQDQEIRRRFLIVVRSLYNPLPIPELLAQLITTASGQRIVPRATAVDALVTQLLELEIGWPVLIVLDNLESLFDPTSGVQHFQDVYAEMTTFLRRFASAAHPHCLLLTCREELHALADQVTPGGLVRSLHLRGVGAEGARGIFQSRGDFRAVDADWTALSRMYHGHPQALLLASGIVSTVYGGDVGEFLASARPVLDDLSELFAWHLDRLTDEEREVVYWLAISRQPIALTELQEDLLTEEMRQRAAGILETLRQRVSLEVADRQFSLQPSMGEFITRRLIKVATERLIDAVTAEILLTQLNVLHSHALLTTQSSQHVRNTQRRLILRPILDAVARQLAPGQTVAAKLDEILGVLHRDYSGRPSYAAGNILNLFVALGADIGGRDFSNLQIKQADLEGIRLRGTDLSGCHFSRVSFTQTFGTTHAVALSPKGDLLAAGDTSGLVHIWRVADGELLSRIPAHENWVRGLLFIADGNRLVSVGDDHRICVWQTRTGRRLRTLDGHTNWVGDLTVHEPSRLLVTASEDGTVRLWNLDDGGDAPIATCAISTTGVRSVAMSPDGDQIACGGSDGSLRLLSPVSRQPGPPVQAHAGSLNALVYLPGNLLASGGGDGRLRLWDPERLTSLGELPTMGDGISTLAAHAETNSLASAGADGVVRLWDLDQRQCVRTLQGHTGAIHAIDWTADGRRVVSGGNDQSVRLWSTVDGTCQRQLVGHVQGVWGVAWSPDGRDIASGHDDYGVRIWDAASGICVATLEGHTQWVQGVAWSPDGRRVASASGDGTVRVWNVETRECQHVLTDHSNWVVSVSWSPDGSQLASGSRDGTTRIWDAWSGRSIAVLRGHRSWVWAVRFSADGRRLATGSEDHTAIVWDTGSWAEVSRLDGHRRGVWCLAWSPDGTRLATAGVDGDVCVWDTATNMEAMRLPGHGAWLASIEFHPGGRLLAGGGGDRTLWVWDLDQHGKERHRLAGHESWIWSVSWSPSGDRLASGSQDETLRVWPLADRSPGILRVPRPYEGMNIGAATGLSHDQRQILRRLGAVERAR